VLAGISGILSRTYDSEMKAVNEEVQNVKAASSLAMSAQYNVTSHKNTSVDLNRTALGAEGSLMRSNEAFDGMKLRINTVTNLTNEALVLINQTKVCCVRGSGEAGWWGRGDGLVPYEKFRDACRKISIKALKGTNQGMARAFFDP